MVKRMDDEPVRTFSDHGYKHPESNQPPLITPTCTQHSQLNLLLRLPLRHNPRSNQELPDIRPLIPLQLDDLPKVLLGLAALRGGLGSAFAVGVFGVGDVAVAGEFLQKRG